MKKISLILFFAASFMIACNEEKPKEENKDLLSTDLVNNPRSADNNSLALVEMPTMDFRDTLHDFGTIKDGATASYDFEFTNNGKNPLIISSAKGSCGCTVPEYPNEPIPPGKSGKLKVEFNSSGKEGHQEKSITVVTNSNRGVHELYIKADVIK